MVRSTGLRLRKQGGSVLTFAAALSFVLSSSASYSNDLKPLTLLEKRQMVANSIDTLEIRVNRSIRARDPREIQFSADFGIGYMLGISAASNIDRSCQLAAQTIATIAKAGVRFVATESTEFKSLIGQSYREKEREGVVGSVKRFREQKIACFKDVGLGEPKMHLPDHPLEGVN
ncbi:MAG: hypothetical protein ACRDBL_00825 [Rhabdaerophilum sp.]